MSRSWKAAGVPLAAGLLMPAALATEGGVSGEDLIKPTIGTLFWTVVTFLALLWILRRFAWGPLLAALQARETSIKNDLEKAREERELAEQTLAEHKRLVADAHRDRAAALAAGREEAERIKAEMLEEGRRQREQLLTQADAQVQASLRQARDELRSTVADLAIQAAGKLLSRNLDDATQRRLVEDYLEDLERSDDSTASPS